MNIRLSLRRLQSLSLLKVTRNFLFACVWLRFGLASSSLRERGDGGGGGAVHVGYDGWEGGEGKKSAIAEKGIPIQPSLALTFRRLA